jgi:hypothetical protein
MKIVALNALNRTEDVAEEAIQLTQSHLQRLFYKETVSTFML